ncbi:transcriptional regulator, TetR family [Dethiosulfatibacter aminovorans DSM 17477]|uniref:Transcriptional regulator, TetR family n=1 Tax=Dethiosulfatibacter aminovorans DSM 17477 TaxID=1121476 RepID=A0A1M6BVS8_9FIRM|nr:TetR/AcrR family transcriptional regulator [Dethiosulfatibacter aminovorans]SHI52624.1 transcriptional regulator, TetR family [Dethiosulfatibacter aminovorans DSM 17477]
MAYKKSSETKKAIINAAIKLFEEKGYYNTNIKDIAGEVNIVHSSIYYYYKNKEFIAREIFDLIIIEIFKIIDDIEKKNPDILFKVITQYWLTFKYIALNKSTQVVHLDLVRYADYSSKNLERIITSYFRNVKLLFKKFKPQYTDNDFKTYLITSDGFSKSLIKGLINSHIDMTIEDSLDYFLRHMLIHDMEITEDEYTRTFNEAIEFCKRVEIDTKNLI